MNKDIQWKQRFQNFHKAYTQLKKGVSLAHPNDLEKQGIIQSFEFTFELAWKTLKDFLESQGIEEPFPRAVLKHAFQTGLIQNGHLWINMLDQRNMMSHTYDEATAEEAYLKITKEYFPAITEALIFGSRALGIEKKAQT